MSANSTRKTRSRKSLTEQLKPYPDFPLSAHPLGKWQKKIRGNLHYFGPWGKRVDGKLERLDGDGWEAALALYNAQKEDLFAGRKPRVITDGFTFGQLRERFLTAKSRALDAGEISPRTYTEYRSTADRLQAAFGENRLVDDLDADDFELLRADIAKDWGPVRLGNEIQRVRTIFKYAYESGLIDRPVRFGPEFKKPSKSVLRKHRAANRVSNGSRTFEAAEIRKMLGKASKQLKAMILLGINCGFGNSDCASLVMGVVDLKRAWIDFPRPKTGIERRCPLWPETVKALRDAIKSRPTPKLQEDADAVFVTKYGARWVRSGVDGEKRTHIDSVQLETGKLLEVVKVERAGVGFYALRHTFRTVADATRDFPAVRLVMGHADESIDSVYRESIDDARLTAVVDHVRAWLFPPKKLKGKPQTKAKSKAKRGAK